MPVLMRNPSEREEARQEISRVSARGEDAILVIAILELCRTIEECSKHLTSRLENICDAVQELKGP